MSRPIHNALSISVAAVLLAACGGSQPPIGAPGAMPQGHPFATQASGFSIFESEARAPNKVGILYVDDVGAGDVELFKNRTWKEIGTITDYTGGSERNWVDAHGNLYVATVGNNAIAEFPPGATAPSFLYTAGLEEPVDVATDSSGNVYAADDALSAVDEYHQGSNSVLASCSIGGADPVKSVAVDRTGDVFVAYDAAERSGNGHITEFRGGLDGCDATPLISTPDLLSGMALDKQNNLVVCIGSAVDIIKPPYERISRRLGSGYNDPVSVRIKKSNDQAYVADSGLDEVLVVKYPGGTLLKTLGSQQGISFVAGAVDSQNFNP